MKSHREIWIELANKVMSNYGSKSQFTENFMKLGVKIETPPIHLHNRLQGEGQNYK